MLDFVIKYWVEFAFGLVATGLGFACKQIVAERKKYKTLLEAEKEKRLDERIEDKLTPIVDDIEQIRGYLRKIQMEDSQKFDIIIASYRFRLCQLCKLYLNRGYMTGAEYEQLNEFYKTYEGLGGNGPAKEWYDKTKVLPVRDHDKK